MGARRWRMGSGFPGYSGPALPRATRSSRGRTGGPRKVPAGSSFEWLASIAGELLQGGEQQKGANVQGEGGSRQDQQVLDPGEASQAAPAGSGDCGDPSNKPVPTRPLQEEASPPCPGVEDKFVVKDGRSQVAVDPAEEDAAKSDNESATSFAESNAKRKVAESNATQTLGESNAKQKLTEANAKQKLSIQCQINQASHEEELKEAATGQTEEIGKKGGFTMTIPEVVDGANDDEKKPMEVEDKPMIHVVLAAGSEKVATKTDAGSVGIDTTTGKRHGSVKVKDEECTSECIISEAGAEKPQKTSRRSRKRKLPKGVHGGNQNKRKHAEFEPTSISGHNSDKQDYYYEPQKTIKRKKHVEGGVDEDVTIVMSHDSNVDGDSEPPAAAAKLRRAKAASVATSPGVLPSKASPRKPGDGHVKVSVKSFTIPELYVDIPESATVGTLKRAVMDAAMNLLGGGLRVCVLLQGRKVPDEGATLSQIGVSHGGKSDSLGFMLEPTAIPASSNHDDPLLVLLHAANQPTSRCPAYVMPGNMDGGWNPAMAAHANKASVPTADPKQIYGLQSEINNVSCGAVQTPPPCAEAVHWEQNVGSPHSRAAAIAAMKAQADNDEQTKNESDSTSTLSQATPCKPRVFDSKAIILHPAMGVENTQGMALVPLRPKNHALEIHKRRIRRPFSVTEVELLVQAVEQLGTGRWRDVKLQAFENAKHRTYVDLKDKWKTLVHTAQIAPHQRRGDPVPQELLDRVITANNYWAAHQAKEAAELES